MADYWVCSECGRECEIVNVAADELVPDYRSDCCVANAEYRRQDDDYFEFDRDFFPGDIDVDY